MADMTLAERLKNLSGLLGERTLDEGKKPAKEERDWRVANRKARYLEGAAVSLARIVTDENPRDILRQLGHVERLARDLRKLMS